MCQLVPAEGVAPAVQVEQAADDRSQVADAASLRSSRVLQGTLQRIRTMRGPTSAMCAHPLALRVQLWGAAAVCMLQPGWLAPARRRQRRRLAHLLARQSVDQQVWGAVETHAVLALHATGHRCCVCL